MKSFCWQFDHCGEPDTALLLREQHLPEPGPGQALVKLRTIGMNRTDNDFVRGSHQPASTFPSCLGQEAVGEILALGPATDEDEQLALTIGARVALLPARFDAGTMGSYRTIGLYPQSALAPVPDSYSNEEGAAYWMAVLTAGGCLERAGLTPTNATGQRILITAATGAIGVTALKMARAWGAETVATTRDPDKRPALKKLADQVIVCDSSDTLIEGVRALGHGYGIDVALDPVGESYFPALIEVAAYGGQIISYATISGRKPDLPLVQMMMKDLTVRGFSLYRIDQQAGLLDWLIDLGMRYSEALRPVISESLSFKSAPAALAQLGRCEHVGKLILTVE